MKRWMIFFGLSIGGLGALHAAGLSTPFADVVVADVPLGQPFKILAPTSPKPVGLYLINPSDEALTVRVRVLLPTRDQLRGGAKPIPDRSWVQVSPNRFTLDGHSEQSCEVTLTVPNEKRYRGRTFQVMIWTRGVPANVKGMPLGAGLLSRVRFTTAKH